MQLPTSDAIPWLSVVGGGTGLLTLLGGAIALGRFSNRLDTVERDVTARATKEAVEGLTRTLESMREDIAQIRDILLNARRP